MANQITGNPYVIDTAASIWSGKNRNVRLIQWIDLNEDITDSDALVISLNGQVITGEIQVTDNTANNLAFWTFGPFDHGIGVTEFIVTTIEGGALIVVFD